MFDGVRDFFCLIFYGFLGIIRLIRVGLKIMGYELIYVINYCLFIFEFIRIVFIERRFEVCKGRNILI